eukprot:CFRG6900T1
MAKLFKALQHPGPRYVAFGWTFFITENLVMSHNRDWIINNYSEQNYHYVYNTLSTTACASIGYGFLKFRGFGPRWASSSISSRPRVAAAFALHVLGMVGFSQLAPKLQMPVDFDDVTTSTQTPVVKDTGGGTLMAQSNDLVETEKPVTNLIRTPKFKARCPMDFKPAGVPEGEVGGLERVSRHATFWSLASLALGSAILTPFIGESLFFGGFLAFALIGTSHQDYRFRRGSGGELTPEKEAITSNVPFVALITGKQDWGALMKELKWSNATIATIIVVLHHLRK